MMVITCPLLPPRLGPIRKVLHRIGADGSTLSEKMSDKQCVLREAHVAHYTPSRAAESAAAVAMNSVGVRPTLNALLWFNDNGLLD